MLNSTELHKILDDPKAYEQQKISVLVKYIFDKTGEDISAISIRPPEHIGQTMLMEHMYNVAKKYYKNGGK
jgi:hypothetical protein